MRRPGPWPRSHPDVATGVAVSRLSPAPADRRANITARCAEIVREREDLDPTGYAYEAKTLQLDAALSALYALGPDPDHHAEV